MLMFIIGFFTAWMALSIFAYFADNGSTGICLFDGWGTILLLLPLYVVAMPVLFIYDKIKKFLKKSKKGLDK
jgi:hypothetical protein